MNNELIDMLVFRKIMGDQFDMEEKMSESCRLYTIFNYLNQKTGPNGEKMIITFEGFNNIILHEKDNILSFFMKKLDNVNNNKYKCDEMSSNHE